MRGWNQLVTRHRVNLSLSDADYQRLVDQAAQEGKMPSTFATDVLKAYMLRNKLPPARQPVQERYTAPLERSNPQEVVSPVRPEKPPLRAAWPVSGPEQPVQLNREQRRAAKKKPPKPGRG